MTITEGTSAAILVRTDGTVDDIVLPESEQATFNTMYLLLNTDVVEVVSLTDKIDFWVDEDGLRKGLLPNNLVTAVAGDFGQLVQPLVGSVLIASRDGGRVVNLSSDQHAALKSKIKMQS